MATYPIQFTYTDGSPATGLNPTMTYKRYIDDTAPVGGMPSITEIGGGWYTFSFTPTKDMVFNIDGGDVADLSRYVGGVITPDDFAVTESRIQQLISMAGKINFRIIDPVYESGRMISSTVAGYASAVDADTNANPILQVSVTATYDSNGNLLSYLSTEV